MAELPIIRAVSGLDNKLDPARIPFDPERGVSALAESTNVTIDNTGRPQRRHGWGLLIAGEHHSVWCDGGDAFLVQESPSWASIMRISPDLKSLQGVVSGLVKNQRAVFADYNNETYYSNGFQKGIITDGLSREWATGVHPKEDINFQGLPIPAGTILERHNSSIAIVLNNTIWFTEPERPDLIDAVRGSWSFPSPVIMVASVDNGLFVSDLKRTYFLEGTLPTNFRQREVSKYPAFQYGLCTERLEVDDLNMQENGGGAVWSGPDGIYVGLPSGRLVNLTREKLNFPDGYTKAGTLLCGYHVITTMY